MAEKHCALTVSKIQISQVRCAHEHKHERLQHLFKSAGLGEFVCTVSGSASTLSVRKPGVAA